MAVHGELDAGREHIVLLAGGLDMGQVAARLKAMTPAFKRSDPPGAVVVPVSWAVVCQLAATFGIDWRPGPRLQEWTLLAAERRTGLPGSLLYSPPAPITPYPWQIEAGLMIGHRDRGTLITDEPGTGKTGSTILGLMDRRLRSGDSFPVLVVCPASVVDAWVDAWTTWAPSVSVVAWRGTKQRRGRLLGTAEVYVTSYDLARVDEELLKRLQAAAVVIDECHYIKTPSTARAQVVRRLGRKASVVVALSGTPITHHPGDLWPTLYTMAPTAWPSRDRWVRRYCETAPGAYDEQIVGLLPAREPEFRLTLLGQQRRVAKADVLSQLPPKVYSVRTVELPAEWRRAYDAMEAQMLAELPDGGELRVMGTLAKLTRISQLACAAAEVSITIADGPDGPREQTSVALRAPSWKVDALLEVLGERPGQQVVAFAPSRQLIMLAGTAAAADGYRVGYIVGDQSGPQRSAAVKAFQAGELDLLCVTTGAGGVGITLTAASTAVFLQRPWSLVESLQSEDRLHRIGAERHTAVEIIDVVARNTIDSRVRAVLRERAGQLAEVLQDRRLVAALLGGPRANTSRRKVS